MSKKKLNNEETFSLCGGVKFHGFAEKKDGEKTLTPADYDRWDGKTCVKFDESEAYVGKPLTKEELKKLPIPR